eukprot:scaffold112364_cov99-Cyclotella_meneghiniana.AAC.3
MMKRKSSLSSFFSPPRSSSDSYQINDNVDEQLRNHTSLYGSGWKSTGSHVCIFDRRSFNDRRESYSESITSHIFVDAELDELQLFREEEHSLFSRLLQQVIEICNLEELVYVACILRENKGLLVLLIGGVASMMMTLLAGVENTNVVRAFLLSVSCYMMTTILVARSARTMISQSNPQAKKDKLTCANLMEIMQSIAAESFVPDEEIEYCDPGLLAKMIQNRSRSNECLVLNETKQGLIDILHKKRNYNYDCCICLATFRKVIEGYSIGPAIYHTVHRPPSTVLLPPLHMKHIL